MGSAVLIDETDSNDIVTLLKQSLGNVVATRRILVACATYLTAIQIGNILVVERTQQQTGRLARVSLIYIDVLAEPYRTHTAPVPAVLVNGLPMAIIVVEGGENVFSHLSFLTSYL